MNKQYVDQIFDSDVIEEQSFENQQQYLDQSQDNLFNQTFNSSILSMYETNSTKKQNQMHFQTCSQQFSSSQIEGKNVQRNEPQQQKERQKFEQKKRNLEKSLIQITPFQKNKKFQQETQLIFKNFRNQRETHQQFQDFQKRKMQNEKNIKKKYSPRDILKYIFRLMKKKHLKEFQQVQNYYNSFKNTIYPDLVKDGCYYKAFLQIIQNEAYSFQICQIINEIVNSQSIVLLIKNQKGVRNSDKKRQYYFQTLKNIQKMVNEVKNQKNSL